MFLTGNQLLEKGGARDYLEAVMKALCAIALTLILSACATDIGRVIDKACDEQQERC